MTATGATAHDEATYRAGDNPRETLKHQGGTVHALPAVLHRG